MLMNEFVIRPAVEDDAPALLELERLAPMQGASSSYSGQTALNRASLYANAIVLVVEAAGQIVSVVGEAAKVVRFAGREATVGYRFGGRTHPAWQGQGLGRLNLRAIRDWDRTLGVTISMGLVAVDNVLALAISAADGLHPFARLTNLKARRISFPPAPGVKASLVFAPVSNPLWEHTLCPIDVIDALYRCSGSGGYKGTILVEDGSQRLLASVWDKDGAIGRTSIDGSRSFFLFDVFAPTPQGLARLMTSAFEQFPEVTQLFCLTLGDVTPPAGCVSESICMVLQAPPIGGENLTPYLDVRDLW